MARNDRIVRVEALKQALCASRAGVALKTLAERHDWNLRGLYRDLKALQSAGYVIDSSDHRYRILGNPRNAAGLPDADERLALYLARQNAHGWKETSLGKALDRLWHRVSASGDGQAALLPIESTPWIVTREQSGIDYGTRRSIIATLERATRARVAVHARYRAVTNGQVSSRTISPASDYRARGEGRSAPRGRAWIETCPGRARGSRLHVARPLGAGRGLKLYQHIGATDYRGSLGPSGPGVD